MSLDRRWLERAKRLQALATTGQHFTKDPYDRERYDELRAMAEAMLADLADVPVVRIEGLLKPGEQGYATPKVDVRAAIIREGRLLLVREKADGKWAMPGGYADVGLSAAENAVKETFEEAGLRATVQKLYAIHYQQHPNHSLKVRDFYKLHFLCKAEGTPKPGAETLDAGFFAEDALPELSVNRTWAEDIATAFRHARDPHRPTEFA